MRIYKFSIKERNMLIHILYKYKTQLENDTEMMDAYKITRNLASINTMNYIESDKEKDDFKYEDLLNVIDGFY